MSYSLSTQTGSNNSYPLDSIQRYLADPIVQSDAIHDAGGYMAYWEKASVWQPQLARMAIDFLSAPGIIYVLSIQIIHDIFFQHHLLMLKEHFQLVDSW